MTILNGKLEFISFWDPIKLETENGIVDLREVYFQVFNSLNGKKSSMTGKMNALKISADETSDRVMKFEKNDKENTIQILLEIPDPLHHVRSLLVPHQNHAPELLAPDFHQKK